MRRQLTTYSLPAMLTTGLLLTACGPADEATFVEPLDGGSHTGSSDGAAETGAPVRDAVPTEGPQTEPVAAGRGELSGPVPVDWSDAPRELTEVELQFFYEPGPYAGDNFDQEAVIDAVLALEPSTAEEWQNAIWSQIHGDYIAEVQAAITFDPSIGEAGPGPSEGQEERLAVGTNHFVLVLDASGSMGEPGTSGTRMDEAKQAIGTFTDALPEGSTVSLRIYGHEGDNTSAGQEESCASSETVYSGPADDGLSEALDRVSPNGFTPLARAIEDAAGDFPEGTTDGIVYVVTDGLETCGGDPVAAAEDLADSDIEPIVNVVGFHTGDADQEQLLAIAEAGGGEYTRADSGTELQRYWEEEYQRMLDAWDEWLLVEFDRIDAQGSERMEVADGIGDRLMTAVDEETNRGMNVADQLGALGHLEWREQEQVWSFFVDRQSSMWRYAFDMQTHNWSDSVDTQNDAWQEVYDTGTAKWTEYYEESRNTN